jgi:hypothetical protein
MTYKCDVIHKSNPHSYYGKPIHNLISIILQCGNTRIVVYAHHNIIITNLASQDLEMESCNISSCIICMLHTVISCIENTFDTWIYWKMWNSCDIHSFIGLYFICQHIYLCVKHVFDAWYSCVKCTNSWMNELCTIFIINSSHAKFVIWWNKHLTFWNFITTCPCYKVWNNKLFVHIVWKGPLLHQIFGNIQILYIFITNLQYHTISLKFVQNHKKYVCATSMGFNM